MIIATMTIFDLMRCPFLQGAIAYGAARANALCTYCGYSIHSENVYQVFKLACSTAYQHTPRTSLDYSLEQLPVCSQDHSVLINSYLQDFVVGSVCKIYCIKAKNAELAGNVSQHRIR